MVLGWCVVWMVEKVNMCDLARLLGGDCWGHPINPADSWSRAY